MTPTLTNEGAATTAPVCPCCGEPTEAAPMLWDDNRIEFYWCVRCGIDWQPDEMKALEFEFLRAEGVKAVR